MVGEIPARLRVAFAGTPGFAAASLAAVHAAGYDVPLVFTQPDRPAGRGLRMNASAVKQQAAALGLAVSQPAGLRLEGRHAADAHAAADALHAAAPDVLVVAAYGLILPDWVLALPRLGCLNIHASLLPRWRGAAPIQRAIEAGDAETGITIMQMDAGLDTGAMLLVGHEAIAADDTAARLQDRLAGRGARLIVQALEDAAQGRLVPRAQPAEGVTYAHKIAKAEAQIDWCESASVIARRVRAFDPFPGAHVEHAGQAIKIWAAEAVDPAAGAPAPPGTVLNAQGSVLVVACGAGALAVREIQRPGGRRQPAQAWIASGTVEVGEVLSSRATPAG